MKKILFAVFLSSILICNVHAFANDLTVEQSNFYVCDGSNKYPIFEIRDSQKHYYFLNMSNSYNFDMRDYNEIYFESTNLQEKAENFTSYRHWFNNLPDYNTYYEPFVSLMIYRYLNNNDELYLCDINYNPVEYDEGYEVNYQRIKHTIEGPSFNNYIRILPFQDYDLNDPYFTSFNINNLNGLNMFFASDETLRINSDVGTYQVIFEGGYDDVGCVLYSDNENYLLKEGAPYQTSFMVTVEVTNPTLTINNYSEEEIDYSSLCFNIVGKDNSYTFCSNEEGVASIQVPVGIYSLEILSDINNDFNKKNIAIDTLDEYLTINWGEDVVPSNNNTIEIIPNDTLELSGIIILLLSTIGIGIAIKKTT